MIPAYPGCPGSKAVKRSLLLLLVCLSACVLVTTAKTAVVIEMSFRGRSSQAAVYLIEVLIDTT